MSKHKFTLPDGTESVNCKERGSYARGSCAFAVAGCTYSLRNYKERII